MPQSLGLQIRGVRFRFIFILGGMSVGGGGAGKNEFSIKKHKKTVRTLNKPWLNPLPPKNLWRLNQNNLVWTIDIYSQTSLVRTTYLLFVKNFWSFSPQKGEGRGGQTFCRFYNFFAICLQSTPTFWTKSTHKS